MPIPGTAISEFHKYTKTVKTYGSSNDYLYFSKRDNCGPAALDFISFVKLRYKEQSVVRVQGYFIVDTSLHAKLDFTSAMKKEFEASGLNWNIDIDRLKFIESSKYAKEWKKCPHYWCEYNGRIYDPSGDMQFLKSKLSKDLKPARYIKVK